VKRSSASLPPLGRVEVEGRLHAGRSFDVWAVRHEDRDLCVKTPGCATSRGFRSDATGFETSLWGGSTGEIAEAGDLVDPGVLLTLEAERIRATGGAWNHDVVGLGYWHPDPPRGRDESAPRWLPALVMPHHPGATLASFPPEQQRRLVVGMMPALWDALVAARHGDLSAENVLVDLERGRFVLIDPGVCLWSLTSSGADDQYDWMDHRVAFTTTPASYPLLPPTYEAPGEGLEGLGLDAHLRVLGRLGGSFMVGPIIGTAWFRPGDREIERAIVRKTLELEGPPRSEDPRPPAADLLAVGILCFRALTGRHPWPRLAERPLWVGAFGEGAGDPWLAEQTAAVLEEGLPTPDGATEAEADLCRALLGLEIRDREHLFTLARRARA
jgi:hypothetical protein